jgi:hypothetical protein
LGAKYVLDGLRIVLLPVFVTAREENAMGQVKANRKYKDTVFRDLFGSEERKPYALSLYNALNGTSHTDTDDLQITTLDDVLYLGLRNDVSLLVGDSLSLWEQQSTYNPNMPLRGLKYFARLYAAHEERLELNEYGTALLRLPTPRFVVVYVGEPERPAREVLRLSDSFGGPGDVEVTATVVNVLAGENEPLLASCDALRGYVRLVRCARSNMAGGMPFDAAVDSAVQQCIDEGLLVDYLLQRRSAVVDMFMDEYDEEKIARLFRRDGFREGREEGLREGTIRAIASLVRDGLLAITVAAEHTGVTEDEIRLAIDSNGGDSC